MGKLRDQKRDVRFGRKGPAADAKKMGKAARDKPKHTKHSLFEPAAAAGGGAAARTGAAKPAAKRAAVVGKGVKRALDDAAAATMPSAAADTAAVAPTNARKAAARARLASAGAKAPPSAPRERKALVKRVLPLWEQIRDAKTPTAQREALIADVLRELNATLTQVCGKHDAARVVQSCYKFGTPEQRERLVGALISGDGGGGGGAGSGAGGPLELARSHYGHKVLLAVLRRGTREHRAALCAALAPHAAALAVHREGALILEAAHTAAADKPTRVSMYRALWGREYALFGEAAAGGAESARALCAAAQADARAAAPHSAAANASVARRLALATALTELALRAAEKGTLGCSLVQRAAAEALVLGSARARAELAAALIPSVVDILHAPAGALAGARALVLCGAKERKGACRALKGLVGKAARELYGCALLIALCDVTDDTVLVGKTLVGELADELAEIAAHAHAHRLLLALCVPPAPQRAQPQLAAAERARAGAPSERAARTGGAPGGGDFADEWLARRLPPELRPVAQARLDLLAAAVELPPPPAPAPAAAGAPPAGGATADADADADAGAGADAESAMAGGKKPSALRRAQLRGAVRAPLLAAIAADARRFVTDRYASSVAEAAMAALHAEHTPAGASAAAGEDGGVAEGGTRAGKKATRKGAPPLAAGADAADAAWDAAADALVDAAFAPVPMAAAGAAAGGEDGDGRGARSAKKAKKGARGAAADAADAPPTERPLFAAEANAGRVLKRLIQTDGAVGSAVGAKVLARICALAPPSCAPAELVKHGGAWVWLALLEAPSTADAARTALRPIAAEVGALSAPGCAALARALQAA
ncbi:hypothetical protein KFE25_005155 [Diacronema lutheri]|uniref:PUM-HD domain-containing protein n=2 Tax=Diacronema lutheri TaxID=2081491 RepID=A0A8J5X841_DIALT|nr:hypothetical protein KFE25_005155 [Diacronema lutheri]